MVILEKYGYLIGLFLDRICFSLATLLGREGRVNYYRRKGAVIGKNCNINTRYIAQGERHLIKIGDNVTLAADCMILTHDGAKRVLGPEFRGYGKPGPVIIHDNCFIGARAIVLPGVTVGPNSIVGAGAVVTKSVPPGRVVAGTPAIEIKTLDQYKQDCLKDPAFRKWGGRHERIKPQIRHFFEESLND
jgi:acetyltransferase-like isoleucine patch superfamily enzyme